MSQTPQPPFDIGLELARASSAETSEAELLRLAGSSSTTIRAAVAGNPNTPPATLLLLAGGFPEAFLGNPALPLLLLENPALFDRIPPRTASALCGAATVTGAVLRVLAQSPSVVVRATVAASPHASVELLCELFAEGNLQIARALLGNARTPVFLLELIVDAGAGVDAIVRHPSPPPHLLAHLARSASDIARRSAAAARVVPADVLLELADDPSPLVRTAAASNAGLPARRLSALGRDEAPEVRAAVPRHPEVPFALLVSLSRDASGLVRTAAHTRLRALQAPPLPPSRS
jgi:hypothetical protein